MKQKYNKKINPYKVSVNIYLNKNVFFMVLVLDKNTDLSLTSSFLASLCLDYSFNHPGHSLNFVKCYLRCVLNTFESSHLCWACLSRFGSFSSLYGPTHLFPLSGI